MPTSLDCSPTKSNSRYPPEKAIFLSGRDAFRSVYRDGRIAPRPSPNKRGRARSEERESNNDTDNNDAEMQIDSIASENALPASAFLHSHSRPVKPLRGSRRQFTQTRSLPVGSFRFSDRSPSIGALPFVGENNGDDDWSEGPSFTPIVMNEEF